MRGACRGIQKRRFGICPCQRCLRRGKNGRRRAFPGQRQLACGQRLPHRNGQRLLTAAQLIHMQPIALGHMGHAAAGIVPCLNFDGVVKLLPQGLKIGLAAVGGGQLQAVHTGQTAFSACGGQRAMVSLIINR